MGIKTGFKPLVVAGALLLGRAAGALADPTVPVAFLRFSDDNRNHAFDCGEKLDLPMRFEDTNPSPRMGGCHGYRRDLVNPFLVVYSSFRQAPASPARSTGFGDTSCDTLGDISANVELSCALSLVSPGVVMTRVMGPTGPIFLSVTADVDEVGSGRNHAIDMPYFYNSPIRCRTDGIACLSLPLIPLVEMKRSTAGHEPDQELVDAEVAAHNARGDRFSSSCRPISRVGRREEISCDHDRF